MLPKGNGVALDLGCGVGVYSFDLCKIGYEVISVDISKSYLEKVKILRSKVGKEWHLILADAQNFPFEKALLILYYVARFLSIYRTC
jgi:ubiquinone/menaquinone biosynthesis C-methylase UbiE